MSNEAVSIESASIESIYTDIIMHHNRSHHNRRVMMDATAVERGHNPNCGDDITFFIKVLNGKVVDAAYSGSGCAISQASVSIMIDLIKGLPVDLAKEKASLFLRMIRGGVLTDEEQEAIGDAFIFEGLAKMPARVKCGTLGWHCLEVTLDGIPASESEDGSADNA